MAATDWDLAPQIATVVSGIATAITAGIAGWALWFARGQLRAQAAAIAHQSNSRDFEAFVELLRDINAAWEKVQTSDLQHREFYLGQLIALYEAACYVFNRGVVAELVIGLFKPHIIEVFEKFSQDQVMLALMNKITSGENTYSEIAAFFEKYSADRERHQNYLRKAGIIRDVPKLEPQSGPTKRSS